MEKPNLYSELYRLVGDPFDRWIDGNSDKAFTKEMLAGMNEFRDLLYNTEDRSNEKETLP